MTNTSEIPEDRELTPHESQLIRWLIDHGKTDALKYVSQINDARVVSRCGCGCASINLGIAGHERRFRDVMHILADYEWRDHTGAMFGTFVFAQGGMLAGLENWSQDGLSDANVLPDVRQLRPIGTAEMPKAVNASGVPPADR